MKSKNLCIIMAIMICGLILLNGCSASTEKEVSNTSDEKKVLTLAVGSDLDSLFPLNMNPENTVTASLVYENLVAYGNGEIVPVLAKSWEFNEDNTRLTFHLQEDVTFHDGEPFNAEAVKANLEFFHSSPNHAFIQAVANIQNIEIEDEFTLTIIYPTPYFAVLNDFCAPDVMVMVSPKSIMKDEFIIMSGTVGTGPYVYEEFKKGEYTRFTRYEDYWGEKPEYDEVIAKYIPESASRIKALQTGEIDMIYGSCYITYDDYVQATSLPDVKGQIADIGSQTRNLVVNASGEILSSVKLRQAIACGIDKKVIADGLTYSNESVADTLFSPSTPYTDVTLNNVWDYNTEKSKSLLEEEGWILNEETGVREKDGKPLKLRLIYVEGMSLDKGIVTAIKSQMAQLGINVETEGMGEMEWWQESFEGKSDLTIWYTPLAYDSPHNYFTPMLSMTASTPAISKLPDVEEFKAMIIEFSKTSDTERVAEIFDYLLNYDNDNVIDIPLTYSKELIVYNSDKIESYTFSGVSQFFDIRGLTSK